MNAALIRRGASPEEGSPRASTPTKPQAPPRDARAFDAWLHGELARLYDSTLREPVPEELLRILQEDPSSKQD
jgi:hypothetical protein